MVNGGWNLGRDAVARKRACQAHRRTRGAGCDNGEVGMFGFAGISRTVEAAAEFDDATAVSQRIQRVGVLISHLIAPESATLSHY
jgi:hypothetical protein